MLLEREGTPSSPLSYLKERGIPKIENGGPVRHNSTVLTPLNPRFGYSCKHFSLSVDLFLQFLINCLWVLSETFDRFRCKVIFLSKQGGGNLMISDKSLLFHIKRKCDFGRPWKKNVDGDLISMMCSNVLEVPNKILVRMTIPNAVAASLPLWAPQQTNCRQNQIPEKRTERGKLTIFSSILKLFNRLAGSIFYPVISLWGALLYKMSNCSLEGFV